MKHLYKADLISKTWSRRLVFRATPSEVWVESPIEREPRRDALRAWCDTRAEALRVLADAETLEADKERLKASAKLEEARGKVAKAKERRDNERDPERKQKLIGELVALRVKIASIKQFLGE